MAKSKKIFTVLLAFCLICACAMLQHVFGDQEPESNGTTGAYVYKHATDFLYQYRSPHRYSCVIKNTDPNDEENVGQYTEHPYYAPAIYRLLNGGDVELGYCCDLKTGVQGGTYYKRLNLEEADYYTAEQAEHIRGILNVGFWEGNGISSSDRIKALAEASGITAKGETLTAAEALSATQLAIWHYANGRDEAYVTNVYSGSQNANLSKDVYDPKTVNAKENTDDSKTVFFEEKTKSHIQAVYSYLIGDSVEAKKPESVIWNFDGKGVVVTAEAVGEDLKYDLKAMFKMTGDTSGTSKLNVTAAAVTSSKAIVASESAALNDLMTTADKESGYYVITFKGLTAEQIQAISEISFTLDGTQTVAQDVYFYEPRGGREIAQCFVGIASGETPVHREWTLNVTMKDASLNMVKYDSTSATETEDQEGLISTGNGKYAYPVKGAVFQLYAEFTDRTTVKVGPQQTTDEKGQISWSALVSASNLEGYYVQEVSAPEGYTLSGEKYYIKDTDTLYVGNTHDTGELVISKTVDGEDKLNHFNFEVRVDFSKAKLFDRLTDDEKTITAGQIEWEVVDTSEDTKKELHPAISWNHSSDGSVLTARISLAHGEKLHIKSLPVGTQCTVTELTEDGKELFTKNQNFFVYGEALYVNAVDDATMTVDITSEKNNEAKFVNQQTEKVDAVFSGQKYLDNRDSQVGFSFSLAELTDSGIRGKTLETVTNDENGTFTFSPLYFSAPGTYRYQVWEEYTLSGYFYDVRVYTIEVTVHRTEGGKLTASTVITTPSAIQQPDSDGSSGNETGRVDSIEFYNRTWSSVIDYDSVTVKKDWNLDKGGSAQPIQVQLLKNGTLYDTVTLSSSNGWRYTWIRLEKDQQWTVQEVNVPEGFSAEVTKEGTIFTITNTYTGEGGGENGGDNGGNGSGDNGNSSGDNGNGSNANNGGNQNAAQNGSGDGTSTGSDGLKTGDSVELTTWILILLIAVLGLAVAAGFERKQK